MNILITQQAEDYLFSLLEKQNKKNMAIRIFILRPGTVQAETCIAYCEKDQEQEDDIELRLAKFVVWLDKISLPFLKDAVVDYLTERTGGTLTIKAPNAKVPNIDENSSLEDKINYYIQTDIAPNLASHNGHVTLVAVVEDNVAVLNFGGGCQGCSMVSMTLKEGIERTLKERIPELKEVRDVTDHSIRKNSYM